MFTLIHVAILVVSQSMLSASRAMACDRLIDKSLKDHNIDTSIPESICTCHLRRLLTIICTLFGCHIDIGVLNLNLGGSNGNSGGNVRIAWKKLVKERVKLMDWETGSPRLTY